MPYTIERNDLARMNVDAIVVAANEKLRIDGGVGLAVARAAGLSEMQAACNELGGCPTGHAVATPAFALKAKWVIHVVGPVWQGGVQDEESVLRQAYDSALNCAYECGARSIALPLVSAHTFGFPVRLSFVIAVEAIKAFLEDHDDIDVHLVLFGDDAMAVGLSLYDNIAEYIDSHYVEAARFPRNVEYSCGVEYARREEYSRREEYARSAPRASAEQPYSAKRASAEPKRPRARRNPLASLGGVVEGALEHLSDLREAAKEKPSSGSCIIKDEESERPEGPYITSEQYYETREAAEAASWESGVCPHCGTPIRGARFCMGCGRDVPADIVATWEEATLSSPPAGPAGGSLTSWLDQLDESFSDTLLQLIDARGMTDAQVYKRANMSRQLFSKIRCDPSYRPTKKTVLALSVALGLDLGETVDLLQRAGFALSHSSKSDIIIEYFIVNGNYDIFAINEALYAFDQPLL